MNGWRTALWATAFLFCGLSAAWSANDQKNDPEVLLEAAKNKALVDGDLGAAIEICEKIVAHPNGDRATAAQALVHIGRCYEKLGRTEARKAYERVVSEYADQAEAVSVANARLALLERESESEEAAGVELQEVWNFPGLDDINVLDISRDGRYCAFIDPGTDGLAVRDLTSGEDLQQLQLTGERILDASISPDNQWVACVEWTVGGGFKLRVVGTDGSSEAVLYPKEEKSLIALGGWAPDSQHVLAALYDTDRVARISPSTLPVRIAAISVADGSIRVLKALTPEENALPRPLFSPDGRYVAYGRVKAPASRRPDIFLIPLDGGAEVPLVENVADDVVLGWLPDGQSFLFCSNRRGAGYDAWMLRVVDGEPQGVPRLVKKGLPGDFRSVYSYFRGPVRTPTGGWAFYHRERGRATFDVGIHLGALDPDTGKLLTAPKAIPRPTAEMETAGSPDFSRDGKHLAYYAAPHGQQTSNGWRNFPGKIVIRSLETGQERELILSPKLCHHHGGARLRWAPDGRSLLLQGRIETGYGGIFLADVETGKLTTVVTAGPKPTDPDWKEYDFAYGKANDYATFPAWSADGRTVFFIRGHMDPTAPADQQYSQVRFMAVDLEAGQEREIYRDPEGVVRDFDPAVSPDGKHVVLGDKKSFAILPTTGGELREIVKFDGDRSPRWSTTWTPDNRHVLFVKFDGPKSELWRVAAEGGEPQRLGNVSGGLQINVSQVRMHPDGQRIAFQSLRIVRQDKLRMLQIVVSDELARGICAANLRRIGRAIEQYKNDHGDVPNWLSDLYPEYLQDTSLLFCPAERTGRRVIRGPEDPEMPCSYGYTFHSGTEGVSGLNVALPVDFPAREGMTWKEARKLQLEYYGPVLPVAMCHHHRGVLLFLSYDGKVHDSEEWYWEASSQAKAGLLGRLQSVMQSQPDTWAQRYDLQRLHCLPGDEDALAKLLETRLEEHPEDKTTGEFLAELPRLRFPDTYADDAEEDVDDGSVYRGSYDLDLIHDADPEDDEDQVVGIRFRDIPVPQGARIKRAYLQLTAYPEDAGSEKTDLVLHAELAANAKPFAADKHNITSRPKTTASVGWSPEPWTVGGERSEKQRTPDLSSLIQEVVDQPDWENGNSLVLIISGLGRRKAESWDGGWSGTPMLYVEH